MAFLFYWNDKLISRHKTQQDAFEQGFKYLNQYSNTDLRYINRRQCSFVDTTEIDWWRHSELLFERFTDWVCYKRYSDNGDVLMDIKRILLEIKRKRYLSFDDINQLTEINPNFLNGFAKCYKLTLEEVKMLVFEKAITFDMVFEYIEISDIDLTRRLRELKITP